MLIPILTEAQKNKWRLRNGQILLKNIIFKFRFQHEGHVCAIFLIYTLAFYRESLLCQFSSRDIRMHTFYLNMGPKWTHKSPKNSHISLKNTAQ